MTEVVMVSVLKFHQNQQHDSLSLNVPNKSFLCQDMMSYNKHDLTIGYHLHNRIIYSSVLEALRAEWRRALQQLAPRATLKKPLAFCFRPQMVQSLLCFWHIPRIYLVEAYLLIYLSNNLCIYKKQSFCFYWELPGSCLMYLYSCSVLNRPSVKTAAFCDWRAL